MVRSFEQTELSIAPVLQHLSIDKQFTHYAFPDAMPELLDIENTRDDETVVAKYIHGSQGKGVHIGRKDENEIQFFTEKNPERYIFEKYVPGVPYISEEGEHEVTYRSVYLVGRRDGRMDVEPITTYRRISPTPNEDSGTGRVVNTASGAIKMAASEKERELLEERGKSLLERIVTEGATMSDVVNRPVVYNMSKKSIACQEEFADWAVSQPRRDNLFRKLRPKGREQVSRWFSPPELERHVSLINSIMPEEIRTPRRITVPRKYKRSKHIVPTWRFTPPNITLV